MRMRQGVRTGLGHGGITCVLQTQFFSFFLIQCINGYDLRHLSNIDIYHLTGAPVAQWVKHWPTDLAVVSLSPAGGEDLFNLTTGFHSTQPSIIIHPSS